jgi:regulatory protein
MALLESSPVISRMERVPRKGEYLVTFSDGTQVRILKDHLAGSGVEEGVSLSRERIRELDSIYRYARAREAAMRLLGVRPRTELEIGRRLRALKTEKRIAERVVADLKAEGLVDDRIFARLWIDEKVQRGDCGSKRISRDLEAKGVERAVIAEELRAALSDARERELAAGLALRKMSRLGRFPEEEKRRKVYAYLLRRGFAPGAAAEAIERAMESEGGTVEDEIR